MARYSVIYENGTIKHELELKGKMYDYTMEECDFGMQSNKPSFSEQIKEDGLDVSDITSEDCDVDILDSTSDDTILDILSGLQDYELG